MVNKGLALFQWKQDIGAAESSCREALAIDDECEAAVATLAQLALQQGRVEEAVGLFERQAELARSEPELVNALTYKFVSVWNISHVVGFEPNDVYAGERGTAQLCEGVPGDGISDERDGPADDVSGGVEKIGMCGFR
jgi:tetratricopeptide (TPR) repeat protein